MKYEHRVVASPAALEALPYFYFDDELDTVCSQLLDSDSQYKCRPILSRKHP